MPSWLPAVNRRVVNPVVRLWAPWIPPQALIVHRGRRSGTDYRTPVLAWRSGSLLYVVLFYGADTQWVRNVLAAVGGEVIRRGRRARLDSPRILRGPSAGMPRPVRRLARELPVLVAELR